MIHVATPAPAPAPVPGTVAVIAWPVAGIVALRGLLRDLLRHRAVSAGGQALPGPAAQIEALAERRRDGPARGLARGDGGGFGAVGAVLDIWHREVMGCPTTTSLSHMSPRQG